MWVRLVRDKESIKTVMILRNSYQKKTKPRDASYLWQSFISATVYRLVPKKLEAAGAFPLQIYICIIYTNTPRDQL